MDLYIATLRCHTWHTWPEKVAIEVPSLHMDLGSGRLVPAKLGVVSYLNRSVPCEYRDEETNIGPLVWSGKVPGLYTVLDSVVIAPEDLTEVALKHRHPYRGEVDIAVAFTLESDPDYSAREELRAHLISVMSMLNLELNDLLTPSAPMQVRRIDGDNGHFASEVIVACRTRNSLNEERLQESITQIAKTTFDSTAPKLRTALELFGSHLLEPHARTRFLLLVIAMEALAQSSPRHQVAIELLNTWAADLETQKARYLTESAEFAALEGLGRELIYRRDSSIRSQVRQLFTKIARGRGDDPNAIARRALTVYDARSTLVHDGSLPSDVLERSEHEARDLLEYALRNLEWIQREASA